jgi:hypothetical protein
LKENTTRNYAVPPDKSFFGDRRGERAYNRCPVRERPADRSGLRRTLHQRHCLGDLRHFWGGRKAFERVRKDDVGFGRALSGKNSRFSSLFAAPLVR